MPENGYNGDAMRKFTSPFEFKDPQSLKSYAERGEMPHAAVRLVFSVELQKLHTEAISRFGAQCLWNASPSQTMYGMRVIVDRLRRYGSMEAWRLATEIEEKLGENHASG
jgi:hypothetical protein